MRPWATVGGLLLCVTAGVAAAAFASPARTPIGWNIVGVTGSYAASFTAPGINCAGADESYSRTISGTYRGTFTGASMNRHRRFSADVGFNLGAAGPAGPSAPIAVSFNRTARERVQVATVTEDDEGNTRCRLSTRSCTARDRRANRSAQNKLIFEIVSSSRVRVVSRVPFGGPFALCGRDAGDPNDVWPVDKFGQHFAISKLNAGRAVWRISWTGRVGPAPMYGTLLRGTLTYRLKFVLVRNPGTPRAYCRILCRRP